jgi:hypothetical protein
LVWLKLLSELVVTRKIEEIIMIPYLTLLENFVDYCDQFQKDMYVFNFYDHKAGRPIPVARDQQYCLYPPYHEGWEVLNATVNTVIDFLDIENLFKNKQILSNDVVMLSQPESVREWKRFKLIIGSIRFQFDESKQEISRKLLLLDNEEKDRLNEALNCFINGCNYSAVAMSVSAIEFRLFSLMTTANPQAKLRGLTLGTLIHKYLANKEEYQNIIPEKHEHLLRYSNTYRVFSVHPKREKITRLIANSILCMTFSFLFDEELKNQTEKQAPDEDRLTKA